MKKNILKTMTVAYLVFGSVLTVYGAGLSVTPGKISETIRADEEFKASITVSNPTQDVSLIEVYPDDLIRFIRVEPRSFTLEPAEEREVGIVFDFEDEGVYSTMISIVARPLGARTFKAGSGIKIPANISVEEGASVESAESAEDKTGDKYDPTLVGIIVLDIGLLSIVVWLVARRIRNKKKLKNGKRT